ncbi:MAG: hypothetical protein RR011_06850, partial [Oscillospiraceae bacterium]
MGINTLNGYGGYVPPIPNKATEQALAAARNSTTEKTDKTGHTKAPASGINQELNVNDFLKL